MKTLIAPHLRPLRELHLHVERGSIMHAFQDLGLPQIVTRNAQGVTLQALQAFGEIDALLERAAEFMVQLATNGRVPGIVVAPVTEMVGLGQPRSGAIKQPEFIEPVRALETEVFAHFRTLAISASHAAHAALAQLEAHAEQLEAGSADQEFARALHAELTVVHEAIETDDEAHPLATLWPRCVIRTRMRAPDVIEQGEAETP
jgi:hypothetical protein